MSSGVSTPAAVTQIEKLRKAETSLRRDADPDVVAVGEAFGRWLDEMADPRRIPPALRVRKRGGISEARKDLLLERDKLLRRLHRRAFGQYDALAAAKIMAQRFSRYQADRWPRESKADEAPAAEPAATFWRLLRGKMPFPKSKQILRILRNHGHAIGTLNVPQSLTKSETKMSGGK